MRLRVRYSLLACLVLVSYPNVAFSQYEGPWVDATQYREFNIVLPENASLLVQQAVEIFKKYWEKCAQREILVSPVNEGKVNVWIGPDACSLEFIKGIEHPELGEEGFFIFTYTPPRKYAEKGVSKHLVICAENDLGAVHGAYSFFEKVCNAKWFAEDCVITPAFRIKISHQNFSYSPPFSIRVICSNLPRYKLSYEAKQALHLSFDVSDVEANWIDLGEAIEGDLPICLSDSDVQDRVKNKIKDLIMGDGGRKFWIFRPPKNGRCECERCKRIIEEGGSYATPYLTLFNEFIEENINLSQLGNKVIAISLSGEFSTPPRNLKISNQICIELDTEGCNFAKPISDMNSKENVEFTRNLQGWLKLTDKVYVRYRAGLSCVDPLFPFPDIVYLQKNLQWLDQKRVMGIIVHTYGEREWAFSEWDLLKRYIMARLMWNPDLLEEDEIKEFLKNYYGEVAGEKLYGYFEYLPQYLHSKDIRCFYNTNEVWWDKEFAERYLGFVKSAIEVAKVNETYYKRLLPISLSANYAMIKTLSSEGETSSALTKLREEVKEIFTQLESNFGKDRLDSYKTLLGL